MQGNPHWRGLRIPTVPPPVRPEWARPIEDICWTAFEEWVLSPGSGVNPRLVTSDNEYGIHGSLIFAAFKGGYQKRAQEEVQQRKAVVNNLLGRNEA